MVIRKHAGLHQIGSADLFFPECPVLQHLRGALGLPISCINALRAPIGQQASQQADSASLHAIATAWQIYVKIIVTRLRARVAQGTKVQDQI